jgi:sortase A
MATAPTVAPLLSEPSAAAVAGSLSIPSLGLVVPIASVSWSLVEVEGLPLAQWDTLPAAVGHHLGSAPLGGPGNCVLSGHSNPDVGGLLQGLDALRKGDALIVTDATGRLTTYHIAEIVQVRELGASLDERRANARYMAPTDDTRLTLITCWPAWAYTHRLILVARPAP